jgi:alanyl-tRNA synthetase
MISSAEIRRRFLSYFEEHGHTVVHSSPLVPANDPTLLFTNAGMVQFKDVFLGAEKRGYRRATSAQKCMRVSGKHNDLENVGPSQRHHTLFEMLGNFSFGDYFKEQAISFAWEFLVHRMGLPPERLYPTVYVDDDEAFSLWQEIAALPPERITRLGKKDNFWSMGDTGPCGPCSEIIYDRGPRHCTCGRPDCNLAIECERWWELWNLVFMQFEQAADGAVTPLPKPSIDTGMGMERMTAVMQGVDTTYETDLFQPVIRRAQELLGHDDDTLRDRVVAYRVIADHSRALTFLISDGVLPGNEGRNYVSRLILRRAARYGKLLGFERPFLGEMSGVVVETMGEAYPELVAREEFVREVIHKEEERFLQTLAVGMDRLDGILNQMQSRGEHTLPGEQAFQLYDTYGFPLELTRDVAKEKGLQLDEAGFTAAMEAQRERARAAQQFEAAEDEALYRSLALAPTVFVGYDCMQTETRIVALVKGGNSVTEVAKGDEVEIVLAETPFYAESGGQVGGTGQIRGEAGRAKIADTQKPLPELHVHRGRVAEGRLTVGETVSAQLDAEYGLDVARNHTATHLLHAALRSVLGSHAQQSGSLVAPDRLRFDFTHLSPLTEAELERVEARVNADIRANMPVVTDVKAYDEAIGGGAIALFGEKYGDTVRVVGVGDGHSRELCGGTHVGATGEIGSLIITGESSIGSGLRRIEAVTGRAAERYVRERLRLLEETAEILQSDAGDIEERANDLMGQLRQQHKELARLRADAAARHAEALLSQVREADGVRFLAAKVEVADMDSLRAMTDRFRERLGSAVVVLGAVIGDRPAFVVAVTSDLVAKGLHAGKLAQVIAQVTGGGGGGRASMASAGGRDVDKLDEALTHVEQYIKPED